MKNAEEAIMYVHQLNMWGPSCT